MFVCFFAENNVTLFRENLIFSINTEVIVRHKFYEEGSVEVVKAMDFEGNSYEDIIITWLEF